MPPCPRQPPPDQLKDCESATEASQQRPGAPEPLAGSRVVELLRRKAGGDAARQCVPREVEGLRVAHVLRLPATVDGGILPRPREGPLLMIVCRSRHSQEGQVVWALSEGGDLAVGAAKAIVVQRPAGIQVTARADAVASIPCSKWVAEAIVSQQAHKRLQVRHLLLCARPREHLRPRIRLETVLVRALWICFLHGLVATNQPDVFEVGDVVARPRPLSNEHGCHILPPGVPRHALGDPQHAVRERLARAEALVIHDHPLVVASAALVPQL
mmetsp:Transcript_4797/g.18147  ORF Transcript_4797/g.18147 Transcript_4797/m.18147 type:complete len:271 (+) Transcript_4797:94-906(+)